MSRNTESIKMQHINNYRNAILEIIKNNTDGLVDQDISSLIKKPPLDSMDTLKTKFLSLAKEYKVVLNTESLDSLLDQYRDGLLKICDEIKKIRIDELSKVIQNCKLEKSKDILKINKKDFDLIHKSILALVREEILENNKIIKNQSNPVFSNDIGNDIKNNIISDVLKYANENYYKQLIDNIKVKMVVKDNTLINIIKEQGDRYLFTIKNSRLFQDLD